MTRRYHLHLPGLTYFGLLLLVGLAAVNSQINLLFWLFGVMSSGLVLSGIVSGLMMTGLRCRRLDPQHGEVGEPLVVRYAITNHNRLLPVLNVHVEEMVDDECTWPQIMKPAEAWVMHIGPRETVHGEVVFWPTQRGQARFNRVRVWTTFPFGIIKKSISFSQPQRTLIYPTRYRLRRRLMHAVTPDVQLGMRVSSHAGAGDDYFGMREYRVGDSMRHIAWKRSAALDSLICIDRSCLSPPKLRVVLNLTGTTEHSLEELAINLAASIIHAADLGGYEIGLTAIGLDGQAMRLGYGHWHVQKLMGELAAIDLKGPRSADRVTVPDMERASMVVIHPDRIEPSIGGTEAWHLSARQFDQLVIGPLRQGSIEPVSLSTETAA
jgi:uncharacterized protein (DUF58 family)